MMARATVFTGVYLLLAHTAACRLPASPEQPDTDSAHPNDTDAECVEMDFLTWCRDRFDSEPACTGNNCYPMPTCDWWTTSGEILCEEPETYVMLVSDATWLSNRADCEASGGDYVIAEFDGSQDISCVGATVYACTFPTCTDS